MTVGVVGCGYVGLVTAAVLAEAGVDVLAIEVDDDRRARLRDGRVPFDEPGLGELVREGLARGTLRIGAEPAEVRGRGIAMIAVPTASDGRDPTEEVARAVAGDAIVVLRGTLTPDRARALAAAGPVVANPEFLREGHALADFRAPARVVLGGEPGPVEAVATLYARIYGPEVPVVRTDLASACLAKLAANALLAVKVAFGNEVAAVAAESGASVDDVVRILGLDPRIGASHLRPSLGFGGPCLPKDARMLADRSAVVRAALGSNALRLDRALALTEALVGGLAGKRIAVWGLTFKPGTDDVRESRSVELVDRLRAAGAEVAAHDPAALPGDPAAAVRGADALVVATPWPEYGRVDPASLAPRAKVVVDPASLLDQRWSGWVRGS